MKELMDLDTRIGTMLAGMLLLGMPALPVDAADTSAPTATTADSATLYSRGVSWDKYLASTRAQRDTWLKNAGREVPPDLVQRFERAGNGLQLLVVTADWCGDSVHSVPYLATLAGRAGVGLRVVDFRTGKAVMEAHRTPDGRASTPTVVLLRDGKEIASWVERPAALQWWFLGTAGQIGETERLERKMSWYDWNRGADALTEIVVLAEQTVGK